MTWIIYWADILPNIMAFFVVIGVLLVILGLIVLGVSEGEESKLSICMTVGGLILLIISLFIPSKETIYGMYAVDKLEEYIENDDVVRQLPRKTIECLDKWLDDQLRDK